MKRIVKWTARGILCAGAGSILVYDLLFLGRVFSWWLPVLVVVGLAVVSGLIWAALMD